MKLIFKTNPEFVKDTLHLHFFKTALYYDQRMNAFPRLQISSELKIAFFMVDYALAYSIENDVYKFKYESTILGTAARIPFPILFNSLIRTGFTAEDIEDMYNKFYNSKDPLLIKVSEEFKNKNFEISVNLFEFLKRKECDSKKIWKLNDLLTGHWNYTLLALNQHVYKSAFDENFLSVLFQKEKAELDKIQEEEMNSNGYLEYLSKVDTLIEEKLY